MKLSVSTTYRETLLGLVYLPISVLVLPVLLNTVPPLLGVVLSDTMLNIVYFLINFLCVCIIFRRFLWANIKTAAAAPWRCLLFTAIGLILYQLATFLLARCILWLAPSFSNVNDNTILELSKEHYAWFSLSVVWLVPVAEETLYRGVLFQGLQRKSRFAAYLLSALVFAMIHILSYLGQHDWLILLLCFVQYLPAGIILAWTYEKTDTMIAPILIHIAVNQIGMTAMR